MKGLSRESRSLIDAARDGDEPSAVDRKRVRAGLARKIAIGAAAGAVAATATHAAAGGIVAGTSGAAAGSAAGAGAGAGAAAVGVAGATSASLASGSLGGVVAASFGAKLLASVASVAIVGAMSGQNGRLREARGRGLAAAADARVWSRSGSGVARCAGTRREKCREAGRAAGACRDQSVRQEATRRLPPHQKLPSSPLAPVTTSARRPLPAPCRRRRPSSTQSSPFFRRSTAHSGPATPRARSTSSTSTCAPLPERRAGGGERGGARVRALPGGARG